MALMLRMSGIPARVATGFSPGSLNRDTGEYRVRDLDAHSWVEVYFNDIGWVTFDPTPPAAPADRAGQGPRAAPDGEDRPRDALSDDGDSPLVGPRGRHRRGRPRRRLGRTAAVRPPACWWASSLAALGGGGYLLARRRMRPHGTRRGRAGRAGAGAAAAGLEAARRDHAAAARAAPAPGRRARLGPLRGPAARALRFGAGQGAPPPAGDRRAMRRELTRGRRSAGAPARIHGSAAAPSTRLTPFMSV